MKKFTFLLLAIVLCSFSGFAQVTVLESNFEDGTTDSWKNYSSAAQGVTTSVVYDGTYSMYITNATAGNLYSLQPYHSIDSLTNGDRYEITFWAKADADATTQFVLQTPSGSYSANYSSIFALTSTWTKFTDTITVSSADRTRALFQVGATATTYYFDDIVLTNLDETTATSETIDDFESNTVGEAYNYVVYWSNTTTASGTAVVAADPTGASTKSLLITPTDYNGVALFSVTLPTGKTLQDYCTLSYDIYAATTIYAQRYISAGDSIIVKDASGYPVQTTAGSWVTKTIDLTNIAAVELPASNSFYLKIGLTSNNSDPYYLDNIELTECSTSGINNSSSSETLAIFKDGSIFTFNQTLENVTLFDMNGRQILKTSNCDAINLSAFPNGIYIVKATVNDKDYVTKVVK